MSTYVRSITQAAVRTARAQEASAQIALDAACGGMASMWNALEANSPWQGGVGAPVWRAVAKIQPLCAACPVLADCANWATLERYTGFAAGTLYQEGVPSMAALRRVEERIAS